MSDGADAFDRLSPAVRYQIVNTLGFTSLRPVQALSTHAILDGDNCVVLAPTAGGKTESAFFPLLSAMDAGRGRRCRFCTWRRRGRCSTTRTRASRATPR
jgi:Lhr-like helicase